MTDKHLSTQFDAELSEISNRVLEMGGLVESQVAQAVYALTNFSGETASLVLDRELRVNQMEVEIDRDLSAIIARRQPTARDLRLDEAAHLEDAVRDLAEFGVELRGQVLVGHVCFPGNGARLAAPYTVLGIAEEWLRSLSRSGR